MLAICGGPWKLIDGQGGGGYRDGEAAGGPPQLYSLDEDLGETRDLDAQKRETALSLQEAPRGIRTEGRSR